MGCGDTISSSSDPYGKLPSWPAGRDALTPHKDEANVVMGKDYEVEAAAEGAVCGRVLHHPGSPLNPKP